MTYRDNVSAMAKKLGVSNDPALREDSLGIAQLSFIQADGTVTNIAGSDMNRGGRLFFQYWATNDDGTWLTGLDCNDRLRQLAADYFAELWEPNPEPGKRKLLDAIREPKNTSIEILWKCRLPADIPNGKK